MHNEVRQVRILHPFHPLCGRRFELVSVRHNWGDERVDYRDGTGHVVSIPAAWTDLAAPDPVVTMSAGRSPFRLQDLVTLAHLLQSVRAPVAGAQAREVGHA